MLGKIPGTVNSGPPVIGDRKSIGTPTGQNRLLHHDYQSAEATWEKVKYVASSRYLGEMFSIGRTMTDLCLSLRKTSLLNHLR